MVRAHTQHAKWRLYIGTSCLMRIVPIDTQYGICTQKD
jgi:hypothetical protein